MVAPEPPFRSLVTARRLLLPHWGLCQKETVLGPHSLCHPTGKVTGAIPSF